MKCCIARHPNDKCDVWKRLCHHMPLCKPVVSLKTDHARNLQTDTTYQLTTGWRKHTGKHVHADTHMYRLTSPILLKNRITMFDLTGPISLLPSNIMLKGCECVDGFSDVLKKSNNSNQNEKALIIITLEKYQSIQHLLHWKCWIEFFSKIVHNHKTWFTALKYQSVYEQPMLDKKYLLENRMQ